MFKFRHGKHNPHLKPVNKIRATIYSTIAVVILIILGLTVYALADRNDSYNQPSARPKIVRSVFRSERRHHTAFPKRLIGCYVYSIPLGRTEQLLSPAYRSVILVTISRHALVNQPLLLTKRSFSGYRIAGMHRLMQRLVGFNASVKPTRIHRIHNVYHIKTKMSYWTAGYPKYLKQDRVPARNIVIPPSTVKRTRGRIALKVDQRHYLTFDRHKMRPISPKHAKRLMGECNLPSWWADLN